MTGSAGVPSSDARSCHAHRPAATPSGPATSRATTTSVVVCHRTVAATWRREKPEGLQDGKIRPAAADGRHQQVGKGRTGQNQHERGEDERKLLYVGEVLHGG